MTLKKAIKILRSHQKWRLGKSDKATDPKQFTEALDIAINLLSNLTPPQRMGD